MNLVVVDMIIKYPVRYSALFGNTNKTRSPAEANDLAKDRLNISLVLFYQIPRVLLNNLQDF